MPYFEFDNHQIFYDTKGNGEDLLLLHGNIASSVMLESEINYFSKRYRVTYFDYPGLGKSARLEKLSDDFWKYNAKCALELINFLKIKSTKVIGTSGGAKVAINLGLISPNLIDKMIADSFFGEYITKEEADRLRQMRLKGKTQLLHKAFWQKMHGDDWEHLVDLDIDLMINTGYKGINPIEGDYSVIDFPVMITASTEDELIPNIEERMIPIIEKIRYCEFKLYDKGKHPLMITRKKLFRTIAEEFFDK